MFVVFKWLLFLCMPFTLGVIALLAIAGWLCFRKQWKPAICMFIVMALLGLLTLPPVALSMGYALESKYPPVAVEKLPKADAIVVLGGGIGATLDDVIYPECYPGADRTVMAARLYHAGKAPLIIPTGGGASKAEKPLLETMRVPASAILCEDAARDTAENARYTIELLRKRGAKKVFIVTSSWHLTRAMMLFTASDMEFIPVGCDYEATLTRRQAPHAPLWQKAPSLASAAQVSVYIKEWLGILFYSFRKPAEPAKATK